MSAKMTPPPTLAVESAGIPADVRDLAQWACWRWGWDRGKGRWTKLPVDPRTDRLAAADNPATWATFDAALARYRAERLAGVLFAFTAADPFAGVDLDDCLDPATRTLTPEAAHIVAELDSYTEISPRGRGVKILVRAAVPGGKGRRDAKRGIEIYDRGRFFALTGVRL